MKFRENNLNKFRQNLYKTQPKIKFRRNLKNKSDNMSEKI